MTSFDPYLGCTQCVLLSELHVCWEFEDAIPRKGQYVVCCLLVDSLLLRPWSKSFGTREMLKVTCVMVSPGLAELPNKSPLLSSDSWAVCASCLHKLMGWSSALGAHHITKPLQL